MANFKALTVPRVMGHANPDDQNDIRDVVNQLVKFSQSVGAILNGLVYTESIKRTDQDQFKVGGPGGPIAVADGGTGDSTLTAHAVLIGEGTSPVGFAGPGATRSVLQGLGASADPAFTTTPSLAGVSIVNASAVTVASFTVAGGTSGYGFFAVADKTGQQTAGLIGNIGSLFAGSTGFVTGSLILSGITSGTVTIIPQDAAGTFNFNLPTTAGSSGQSLLSAGGGSSPMTWGSPALLVGTTTITSGTSGRVLYDNAGVLGEMTNTGTGTVNVLQTAPTILTSLALGTAFTLSDSGGGNSRMFSQSAGGIFSIDTDRFLFRNQAATHTFLDINDSSNSVAIGRNSSTAITLSGPTLIGASLTLKTTSGNNGQITLPATGIFTFDCDRTVFRNAATTNTYIDVDDSANTIALGRSTATVNTVNGYIAPNAAQTTVNGSVAGTAVFSQPFTGATLKRVLIYLNALNGTASYTFPTAFTNTPSIVATNDVAAGIVTARSTTAITVTGAVTSGFLELIGY